MSKILIVDDESSVVTALLRLMRRGLPRTVQVEGFTDPELALHRARESAFSVVISDFRMPQMDGLHFLRQWRALQPDAVRLVLSASTEVETITKAINDVEVFRYLVKPWNDEELLAHVRAALDKGEAVQQERTLADEMRLQRGELSPQDMERKRLEAQEPGITHVEWGPQGEVLMPDLSSDLDAQIDWSPLSKTHK